MPIGTRLSRLLNRSRTEYARSVHRPVDTARQVAYEESISPHRMAKTVVFHSDRGYGMAVVPADTLVDLPELRFVLGLSNVRLATKDELQKLFPDSEVGAMPPFGNLYGIPVYVDANLAEEDVIAFNAGSHKDVVYMRFVDFKRLARPAIKFFTKRNSTIPA
jgi:Ala-tRNA(Pro) deacylase